MSHGEVTPLDTGGERSHSFNKHLPDTGRAHLFTLKTVSYVEQMTTRCHLNPKVSLPMTELGGLLRKKGFMQPTGNQEVQNITKGLGGESLLLATVH